MEKTGCRFPLKCRDLLWPFSYVNARLHVPYGKIVRSGTLLAGWE